MDEPGKEINKSINAQHERMAGFHWIEIEKFIHNNKFTCAIFELSKRFYINLNFMHHKSQLSVSG